MKPSPIAAELRHKVAIIIQGGVIRGVFSDDENLLVEIVDLDDDGEQVACVSTANLYPVA